MNHKLGYTSHADLRKLFLTFYKSKTNTQELSDCYFRISDHLLITTHKISKPLYSLLKNNFSFSHTYPT